MSNTTKQPTMLDNEQVIRNVFNEPDKSLTVNGFLVGKTGHKVTMALSTTNIANDTETYTFLDGATTLYEIEVIYTDGTRAVMISAERIS